MAVGGWNAGPTPQMIPSVGALRKKPCVVRPRPNREPPSGLNPVWWTAGRMVREITFQRSFSEIGMTGWMLT